MPRSAQDHLPRDSPDHGRSSRSPFPWWVWLLFLALYAAIIPWWLPQSSVPVIWLGLPRWVVTALLGGLAVAITANVLMTRFWTD